MWGFERVEDMNTGKDQASLAADLQPSRMLFLHSLVIPVYRNEANIPALIDAVKILSQNAGSPLEIVFVIDGSPDRSGELLVQARSTFTFPYQIVFHSRNFGAFAAIRTGLEHARGENVAVMAADLQEPGELILEFLATLEAKTADVVFGVRASRRDHWFRDALSNTFWWLYRQLVIKDVPKGGVDIFACNRAVVRSVLDIQEPNSSLIAQLFWVGFRRSFVPYRRREREEGTSAWTFTRRMRYMMDSIFSFSDLPILMVLWVGVVGCVLSLAFGIFVALARVFGFIEEPGYTVLVVLITFSFSAMLAAQGIIGSYLWRTFENTKRRPLSIVKQVEMEP